MNIEVLIETTQCPGDCTPVRVRRPWSDMCVSVLRADYPTSTPVSDIAARLGRSIGSLYGKARRLELRRPPRGKRPKPVVAPGEAKSAMADDGRAQMPAAGNPTVVNGQAALANEPPPPPSASGLIACTGEIKPRLSIRTRVGGRPSVWFPQVTERLMRLWLANVHPKVIGDVLGPQRAGRKVTASAVSTRGTWVGLPSRFGLTLVRDRDVASEFDRQAAPLPKTIRHGRETADLRICPLTGTPFYSRNKNRLSKQAKATMYYRGVVENGMAW